MDLEDEDLDFGAPMPHTKHQSYEVIQAKSIMDRTKALVKEVVDTLALPSETLAALLLRRFEWNKQKLIDEWLEDPDRVLKKLGMTNLNLENKAKTNAKFKCPVCDELYPAKETFALGCGHRYCADCWQGFLTVQIRSGPTCTTSHCPAPKCPVLVHEEAFRQFCAPEVFAKYQVGARLLTTRSFCTNPLLMTIPLSSGARRQAATLLSAVTGSRAWSRSPASVPFASVSIAPTLILVSTCLHQAITHRPPVTLCSSGARRPPMNRRMSSGCLPTPRNVHSAGHPLRRTAGACT